MGGAGAPRGAGRALQGSGRRGAAARINDGIPGAGAGGARAIPPRRPAGPAPGWQCRGARAAAGMLAGKAGAL